MHAAIHHHVDRAVLVARHDRGLTAEAHGLVVTDLRHFALVTEEDPATLEDPFHLEREDLRLGVDLPMDAMLLHQFVEVQLLRHGPHLRIR